MLISQVHILNYKSDNSLNNHNLDNFKYKPDITHPIPSHIQQHKGYKFVKKYK